MKPHPRISKALMWVAATLWLADLCVLNASIYLPEHWRNRVDQRISSVNQMVLLDALFLSTALMTFVAWPHHPSRASRRANMGHCVKCNYDRRGLPATNPCPECGAFPVPSTRPIR
jgi:hypothetical protein